MWGCQEGEEVDGHRQDVWFERGRETLTSSVWVVSFQRRTITNMRTLRAG